MRIIFFVLLIGICSLLLNGSGAKSNRKYIIMDFYAEWCPPCRMLAPVIEEIQKLYKGINIEKVDIDKNPRLAENFKVSALPTLIFLKSGKELRRYTGYLPKEKLVNLISRIFLQDLKQEILKCSHDYARSKNYKLNSDKKKLDEIITALAINELHFGKRFCPCRPKKEENICFCVWHSDEIKKLGRCRCGLLFAK